MAQKSLVLVTIEGAGPDELYRTGSFMTKLVDDFRRDYTPYAGYIQADGTIDVFPKADLAAAKVRSLCKQAGGSPGVIIAGYSRGGAAAIAATQMLGLDYPIEALLLFDAVGIASRQSFDVGTNVRRTCHAYRMFSTMSRPLWGNCGMSGGPAGTYQSCSYWITHGGFSGVEYLHPELFPVDPNALVVEAPMLTTRGQIPSPYSGYNHTLVKYRDDRLNPAAVWNWLSGEARKAADAFISLSPEAVGIPVSAGPPHAGGGSPAVNGGSKYTVASGDSLSLITGKFWGDVLLWPILYDANKPVVGPDPNKIVPGQKLTVPSIAAYSQQQRNDARARGRNWH